MIYIPPTTEDLRQFKDELGYTGKQMADLFALGGDHQWRKYTGGSDPREMSEQMLFFGAAALELDAKTIERVRARMAMIGARGRVEERGTFSDGDEEFEYHIVFEQLRDGRIEVVGTVKERLSGPWLTPETHMLNSTLGEARVQAKRIAQDALRQRRANSYR
jgi:hypothetical protein